MTPREKMRRRAQRNRSRLAKMGGGRPRLSVYRSSKHIYAQIIDDKKGETIAAASTAEGDLRGTAATGATVELARKVGETLAKRAKDKGLTDVVFDRGGYIYHGRVKALADAAREGGLNF